MDQRSSSRLSRPGNRALAAGRDTVGAGRTRTVDRDSSVGLSAHSGDVHILHGNEGLSAGVSSWASGLASLLVGSEVE